MKSPGIIHWVLQITERSGNVILGSSLIGVGEYPGNSPLVKNGNTPFVFTPFKKTQKNKGSKILFDRQIPLKNPCMISDPDELSH